MPGTKGYLPDGFKLLLFKTSVELERLVGGQRV